MNKTKLLTIITCTVLSISSLTACNSSSASSSSVTQSAYEKHECQDITFEIPSELKYDGENCYSATSDSNDNNYIYVMPVEYRNEMNDDEINSSKETLKKSAEGANSTVEFVEDGEIDVQGREGIFIKSKYSSTENKNMDGLDEIMLFFNVKNKDSDGLNYMDKDMHTINVTLSGKYATKEQMQHFIDSIDFKDR